MSNRTCLVCGKSSSASSLLCPNCGAPLPDEEQSAAASGPTASVGPTRRSTNWLKVGGLALLVLGVVVGAYVWLTGSSADAREMTARMPKGMKSVGGVNMHGVLRNEWVKQFLDAPGVSSGLTTARNEWGVDLLAMDSIVGGVQFIDGELHFLTVVSGKFDGDKLKKALSPVLGDEVEVAGAKMLKFPFSDLLAPGFGADPFGPPMDEDDEAAEDMPEPPPPPKVADMFVGTLDNKTLVFGSKLLIERYKGSGETIDDDPEMAALLKKVDDKALGWGVGVIAKESLVSWGAMLPTADQELMSKLVGTTLIYQLFLTDSFKLQVVAEVPDESLAKQFMALYEEATGGIEGMNMALALIGGAGVEPRLTHEGRTIRFELSVKLPDVPAL